MARILRLLSKRKAVVVQTSPGVSSVVQVAAAIANKWPKRMLCVTQLHRFGVQAVGHQLNALVQNGVVYQTFNGRSAQVPHACVEVMVDNSLLRRIALQQELPSGVILIDDTYKRLATTDLLIALIERYRKSDTSIVVMAENRDEAETLAKFLHAPIVGMRIPNNVVSARHVQLRQREHHAEAALREVTNIVDQFLEGSLYDPIGKKIDDGTVAVLVPGKEDITNIIRGLEEKRGRRIELRSCHRESSASDIAALQDAPAKHVLRVVVATEIVRSSVSLPELFAVIDTLEVKRLRTESGERLLRKMPIARSDVDRMIGRISANRSGWYIPISLRLGYEELPDQIQPEFLGDGEATIHASLCVAMTGGDIPTFPYLQTPDKSLLSFTVGELQSWGALDENGKITNLGRRMFRLSIKPKLAAAVAAAEDNVLPEVVLVAATLDQGGFYARPPRDGLVRMREDAVRRLLSYIAGDAGVGWHVLDVPRHAGEVSFDQLPSWIYQEGDEYVVNCTHRQFPHSDRARWALEFVRWDWRVENNNFAAIVNAYCAFKREEEKIGSLRPKNHRLSRWCCSMGLDLDKLRAIEAIMRQIRSALSATGLTVPDLVIRSYSTDNLTKALLRGLYRQVGVRSSGKWFGGVSGDFVLPPILGVDADLVLIGDLHSVRQRETVLMPRFAARIELPWLEDIASFSVHQSGVVTPLCVLHFGGERIGSVAMPLSA